MRRMFGLLMGLMLLGCGEDPPSVPSYKSFPPLSTGGSQAPKAATLSGFVYMAASTTIDPQTQLPEGYQRVSGGGGRVSVRLPGTPLRTREAPIVDGAYIIPDLPIGVELEVTASFPKTASRRQVTRIVLPAGRRLNFAYDPRGAGSYLLLLRDPPR